MNVCCKEVLVSSHLGPVKLQLIIRDSPGLICLQLLRCLLLHIVLSQLIGLNHLGKILHAAKCTNPLCIAHKYVMLFVNHLIHLVGHIFH